MAKDGNKYDDLISIWVDYFNIKYPSVPPCAPLDPDVVKALLGSESRFRVDPKENRKALGIAQLAPETFVALQNPEGEAKDFIFKGIRKKDLKDPDVAIPLAVRWLMRKKQTATSKLKRAPSPEELIMEYKGWLKSKSKLSEKGLTNFRKQYARLKKK